MNDELTWTLRRHALAWVKAYWECLMDRRPVSLVDEPTGYYRQRNLLPPIVGH